MHLYVNFATILNTVFTKALLKKEGEEKVITNSACAGAEAVGDQWWLEVKSIFMACFYFTL